MVDKCTDQILSEFLRHSFEISKKGIYICICKYCISYIHRSEGIIFIRLVQQFLTKRRELIPDFIKGFQFLIRHLSGHHRKQVIRCLLCRCRHIARNIQIVSISFDFFHSCKMCIIGHIFPCDDGIENSLNIAFSKHVLFFVLFVRLRSINKENVIFLAIL